MGLDPKSTRGRVRVEIKDDLLIVPIASETLSNAAVEVIDREGGRAVTRRAGGVGKGPGGIAGRAKGRCERVKAPPGPLALAATGGVEASTEKQS
jgi:hypothetical protein